MNGSAESKRGLPNNPPGLSTLLLADDINYLLLLSRFGQNGTIADPRKPITFSHHRMTDDLSQLLVTLEEAGRINVKHKMAKCSYSPQLTGNMEIRPNVEDGVPSVLDTFKDVKVAAIKPLLDFQATYPQLLKSATIFPNISSRGLKGVSLDFDIRQDHWWGAFFDLNWPFGRGLITTELPINADEFLEHSNDILLKTFEFGKANSPTLKYLRYYYRDDGRVFMVMAAGPSDQERQVISNTLKNTHRPGKTSQFMKEIEGAFRSRRQEMSRAIINHLNLISGEEVFNTPYVTLNIEHGLGVSGGVGGPHNTLPFTTPNMMVVHFDVTDQILPLGTRRNEARNSSFQTSSRQGVRAFVNSLNNQLVLSDLSAGYHPEMEQKPLVKK